MRKPEQLCPAHPDLSSARTTKERSLPSRRAFGCAPQQSEGIFRTLPKIYTYQVLNSGHGTETLCTQDTMDNNIVNVKVSELAIRGLAYGANRIARRKKSLS